MNSSSAHFHLDFVNTHFEDLSQEMYVARPLDKASRALILIHGHASSGWSMIGMLGDILLRRGYAICCPTMMGYGGSEGSPDYCGPRTVEAIEGSIHSFFENYGYSPKDAVIWGVSRGAIVASLLACRSKQIAGGAILQAGAYNLAGEINDPDMIPGIRANIVRETDGASEEALRARSAVFFAETFRMPVQILHGAQDKNCKPEQAKSLAQALKIANKAHELHLFEESDHFLFGRIGREKLVEQFALPFVERSLGSVAV
jgi:dipeptidyl aminopeptidase/acylaminoacyl peptidase